MFAFHGDKQIKSEVLTQLKQHYKLDEIIKGKYWESGKGCAVGCTIHSSDHSKYEYHFGIPRVLAKLEDKIFEGLPNDEAKEFPIEFMKAIKPGVDLTNIYKDFLVYILVDEVDGVINFTNSQPSKNAIIGVSEIFTKNITDINEIQKCHSAAYDSSDAANAYAAYAAVNAAVNATNIANANAAAYAAANAVADAADAAAYAGGVAARKKHYSKMKTKLLELLKASK